MSLKGEVCNFVMQKCKKTVKTVALQLHAESA